MMTMEMIKVISVTSYILLQDIHGLDLLGGWTGHIFCQYQSWTFDVQKNKGRKRLIYSGCWIDRRELML